MASEKDKKIQALKKVAKEKKYGKGSDGRPASPSLKSAKR